jgi:hypothetical protein
MRRNHLFTQKFEHPATLNLLRLTIPIIMLPAVT